VSDSLYRLKYALPTLPDEWRHKAEELFAAESQLHARFRKLLRVPLRSFRIRCHGDCDLAQILYVGNDFVFIDFEGSPLQTLGERRIKRSPLRDVASMMRSFDYVALISLYGLASGRGRPVGVVRKEDFPLLESWTRQWRTVVRTSFAESYREHAQSLPIGRYTQVEWDVLLDTFLLEKMLLELIYELEYRPDWLFIPLIGLCEALGTAKAVEPEPVPVA
jgi:maltose alpha-D-glucosyltransferase/alpha-amylase